ncbi:MAG: divalent-cation tolerance protein CutA [Bdellovibrionales bacterium CG10_big_fil_rev_8_21_14_0_10_45_34]|nr:MAG: divalent-cation tolerance protein CutA [Bdellovibrionales bacterium CG10_big_fil_rev_8_21_14_0_10_45_34]
MLKRSFYGNIFTFCVEKIVTSNLGIVYSTFESKESATQLARTVIGEKLAACVNILPAATSLYIWNEQLKEDQEFVAIFKTSGEKLDALTKRVEQLHPYDCPCVIVLREAEVNNAYRQWVESSLK